MNNQKVQEALETLFPSEYHPIQKVVTFEENAGSIWIEFEDGSVVSPMLLTVEDNGGLAESGYATDS